MTDLDSNGPRRDGSEARQCFRDGRVVAAGGDSDDRSLALSQPQGKVSNPRQELPYGKWTCADGRAVLFNRAYKPIWQRWPDGLVTRANHDERVPWIRQEFFFNDGNAPFYPQWLPSRRKLTAERKATKARCESVLVDWGVG